MIQRTLQQLTQMLNNLDAILDKGSAHATATEGMDPETLIQRRLAPDMFPFVKQIQACTDTAKFIAARCAGQEAPSWPDEESTVDEVKARLKKGIDYLESMRDADYSGWEERPITLGFMPGMYIEGADYVHQFALPNFYFHAVTAYDILRNAGVEIGKRDFIGHMSFKPLPS